MADYLGIKRLFWDDWNREHISKHDVTVEEAEEAVFSEATVIPTYKDRFQILGPTPSSRVFSGIVGQVPGRPDGYYVFWRETSQSQRTTQAPAKIEGRQPMSKLQPSVDLGYPTEAHGDIPSFANIEEEAEFWDTHDSTDDLADVEPIVMARQLPVWRLMVSLNKEEMRALEASAAGQGVSPSTLAQRWIAERLRQEITEQLQPAPEVEHGAAD